MTARIWLMAAAIAVALATQAGTQSIPDFSGTWVFQATRSESPVDVWGQTRALAIVITQSSTELPLATTGGGLSVPQRFNDIASMAYRSSSSTTVSETSGPSFER